MSDQKEKNPKSEKKQRNIFNYAIVMIVSVIIIILFAAMADNRENEIDNRINETERNSQNIQNEIVRLQDENYELKKQAEANQALADEYNALNTVQSQLTEVWNMISAGDSDGARQKIRTIDGSALSGNTLAYYSALCELLNINN